MTIEDETVDKEPSNKKDEKEEVEEEEDAAAIDERDRAIGEQYGAIFGMLAGRRTLSRKAAIAAVMFFYLRRGLLAVIILAFYGKTLTQVIGCLSL